MADMTLKNQRAEERQRMIEEDEAKSRQIDEAVARNEERERLEDERKARLLEYVIAFPASHTRNSVGQGI